ncbi:MAG TPA: TIGR03016 family PEP-CTERM system-associated outer membrane protein [Xanthomonadaceae bacterium]|nr:TIGR03016 family PEP-CTERM system-associated outer membrane protein [Xanthomonadaceae bacterium]
MKSASRKGIGSPCRRLAFLWPFMPGALLAGFCWSCWAQEVDDRPGAWRITPRLGIGATYSDNINLAPANEAEDDLVLQVDPGVSVRKRGGRLDLRLDYTARGLLYANNGDANELNNELLAFGTAELYDKHLFLDAYGSISQVPVTSGGRTDAGSLGAGGASPGLELFNDVDFGLPGAAGLFNFADVFSDIALTNNQATAHRFGISPYWRQTFGGWVDLSLRYRYDDVFYDDEEDDIDDQQPDRQVSTSDSQTHTIELNLANGRRSDRLQWTLDYFYQRQEQDEESTTDVTDNGDDRRESVVGQLNYRLNRRWALLAEAGYEDNQVADFENSRDGAYWGLGAMWSPNRFVELKGLYGPDLNEMALRWNPSVRTNLEISRRDQDVGVDPGVRWQGLFSHRTRRSTWSASYIDEVTNNQQLLGSGLLGVGPDGQPLPLDEQGQVVLDEGPFGLSDRNFRRKRFDAGVIYRRGPTGLLVSVFNEDREGQDPASDESTQGASALWTWRFAPRTASFLGAGWGHDDLSEDRQNDYWVSIIGLARVFTPDSGGLISYRYYRNDADPAEQGFRENRFNIRFNMQF